jgi:hypothetical protein
MQQSNRMMSKHASKLFAPDHISVNACHPGVVTSALLSGLGMAKGFDSADKGAATPIYLACHPAVQGVSGEYFVDNKVVPDKFSVDEKKNEMLWSLCEALAK